LVPPPETGGQFVWQSWSEVHEPHVPPLLLPLDEPLDDPLDELLDEPLEEPLLDPELLPLEPPLELVLPESPGVSKPGPVVELPEPQAATSPKQRRVAASVCSDGSLMSAFLCQASPPRQHPRGAFCPVLRSSSCRIRRRSAIETHGDSLALPRGCKSARWLQFAARLGIPCARLRCARRWAAPFAWHQRATTACSLGFTMTTNDAAAEAPAPQARAGGRGEPHRVDRPRRRLVWLAVALAVVAHLPALLAPFMLDDWAQTAMAEGRFGAHRSPFDLYDYIDDDNRGPLFDRGAIPWWTHPRLVVRVYRPLASALVWADHAVFGRHPAWHHAHSLVWWALAVVGVHALLRRSFSRRAARLGAAVFAFAPCHVMPLLWLANREVLVSAALGVWGLVWYVRWRDGRQARAGLASLALFSAAVLAGEYTLCFVGYLLPIELVRRREPLTRRALGLAVFVLPVAAYVAMHVALRYDAHGSGFYRNPLHDLGAYAREAPRRLAMLLGEAWLGVDDTWTGSSSWALALLGVVTVALLAVPTARLLRELDGEPRRRATWLLAGSVLSLGPVLSVAASVRLLAVSMIGVSAIVGLLLDRAWFPPTPPPRRGAAEWASLVALLLGFAHLVRGPLDTCLLEKSTIQASRAFADRIAWLRAHIDRTTSTVFVLRGDTAETVLWAPMMLGDAAPPHWRVLSFASGRSLLLRTGDETLELVASQRPLFNVGPDDLFRSYDALRPGDSVTLGSMRATVLKVDDHQMPRRLRFEMDRDLDDPSYQWITEGDDGFREVKLPPKGYGQPVLP
jgi:hypothetical protein